LLSRPLELAAVIISALFRFERIATKILRALVGNFTEELLHDQSRVDVGTHFGGDARR